MTYAGRRGRRRANLAEATLLKFGNRRLAAEQTDMATLGMEPGQQRALEIIRLASEQADEIEHLQKALDKMTKRCQAAEYRIANGE